MPAGERCRRAVCGRTALTVRCGVGRQPRTSRPRPRSPRTPPADPTSQEFMANGGGRPSRRRLRSAASPGRTGSRGRVGGRGWWRSEGAVCAACSGALAIRVSGCRGPVQGRFRVGWGRPSCSPAGAGESPNHAGCWSCLRAGAATRGQEAIQPQKGPRKLRMRFWPAALSSQLRVAAFGGAIRS